MINDIVIKVRSGEDAGTLKFPYGSKEDDNSEEKQ